MKIYKEQNFRAKKKKRRKESIKDKKIKYNHNFTSIPLKFDEKVKSDKATKRMLLKFMKTKCS